jgi:hypothetical protein
MPQRVALLRSLVRIGFDINVAASCGICCSGSLLASTIKKGDFMVATELLQLGTDRERTSEIVQREQCKTLVLLAMEAHRGWNETCAEWIEAKNGLIRKLVTMGELLEAPERQPGQGYTPTLVLVSTSQPWPWNTWRKKMPTT